MALGAYLLLIPHLGAMGAALGSLLGYGAAALVALLVQCQPRRAEQLLPVGLCRFFFFRGEDMEALARRNVNVVVKLHDRSYDQAARGCRLPSITTS